MPHAEPVDTLLSATTATLRNDAPVLIAVPDAIDRLCVKGTDAFTFLQGQVTCDMTEVERGALRLGSHCTPKGRAQASFIAARDEGGVCLFLPPGLLEPTRQQLKKYAAFSKVTLDTQTGYRIAAVAGPQAAEWLQAQAIASGEALRFEALPGFEGGFLVTATPAALEALLANAPAGSLTDGDRGFWQVLTLARQAHVFPQTQERFIPQELNHDLVGGISFRKGCYKGQEIIARLHFRGTPKYRARIYTGTGSTPVPGSVCEDDQGQSVGEVAQSVESAPGHSLVIAVVRQDSADGQGLRVRSDSAAQLRCDLTPIAGACAIPPAQA